MSGRGLTRGEWHLPIGGSQVGMEAWEGNEDFVLEYAEFEVLLGHPDGHAN